MWTQSRCEACHRIRRADTCPCGLDADGPAAWEPAPTAVLPAFPGDLPPVGGDGGPADSARLRIFDRASPEEPEYLGGEAGGSRPASAEGRPGLPAPQVAAVAGAGMLAATVAVCVLAVVTAHGSRSAPAAAATRPPVAAAPAATPSARPAPPSPAEPTSTATARATPTPTAPPPPSATTPSSVTVRGASSGRCLTVRNLTDVEIRDCDGDRTQQWTLTAAGELRDADDACLVPRNTSGRPSAVVHLRPCVGDADQTWAAGPNGAVVGVRSGLCLDAFQGRTGNGTPVLLRPCTQQPTQRWTIR